jgi:hypothetical protein
MVIFPREKSFRMGEGTVATSKEYLVWVVPFMTFKLFKKTWQTHYAFTVGISFISSLQKMYEEAYDVFFIKTHLLVDFASLTQCYTVHVFRPHIDLNNLELVLSQTDDKVPTMYRFPKILKLPFIYT